MSLKAQAEIIGVIRDTATKTGWSHIEVCAEGNKILIKQAKSQVNDNRLSEAELLEGLDSHTAHADDRGYKGSGVDDIKVLVAGQKRGVPKKEKPWMGRRNSVEPIIGHLKSDGKLRRCFLKGVLGDAINVILSACGQNLRKLLKWLYCAPYFGVFLRQLWLKITFLLERPKNSMAFLA